MPPYSERIEKFLRAVRRRTSMHRLWSIMIGAAIAIAALLCVVGLYYVLRGYAVPGVWIVAVFVGVLIAAAAAWIAFRINREQAARFADRFFDLQDTVTSYLHFSAEGHREGYYALQARQTAERISGLDAKAIRYRPSRRLLGIAAGLAVVAAPLCLCPPSEAVLQEMELQKITKQETAAINQKLLEEAEKLIEESRKDEEKLIEPDKLRWWVEELKATTDKNEALRQYARLEKKLKTARMALQRKEDEQLLERAAKELAKGEETRGMAETLEQKDYDKAAEKLDELRPKQAKPMDQHRRDMARLKAIAQRMADAAVAARQSAKSSKPAKSNSTPKSTSGKKQGQGSGAAGNSKSGSSGEGSGESESNSLGEAIEELAKACEACEKSPNGDKKLCQACDKLCDQLKKLALCKRVDCKLCKLCRSCSQCQSNLCSSCLIPKAGGKKAGMGTVASRRDARDALIDNGQTTELKGIKGQGPSMTAVEAAEEGSGVSTRRATAHQRDFMRQMESFVQREDVPESVRDGVKQYFEIIHENDVAVQPEENRKE